MKHLTQLLVVLGLLLAFAPAASAQLWVNETFDYDTDEDGNSLLEVAPEKWVIHSGSATDQLFEADNLTLGAYPSGTVGSMLTTGGGGSRRDISTTLGLPVSEGTVWVAFLFNVASSATNMNDYIFHFNYNTSRWGARISIQGVTATDYELGITRSGSAPTGSGDITNLNLLFNTTYLVVASYQFVDGTDNDVVNLYVFSDYTTAQAGPGTPAAVGTAGADIDFIQQFANRQAGDTWNGAVDGIRVASSYQLAIGNVIELSFDEAFRQVNENATSVTFNVTPSAAPTADRTVDITTFSASTPGFIDLTPGTEYTITPTTLTFPSGSTASQSFTVNLIGDATAESSEVLGIRLTNASNPEVAPASDAFLFVHDDDGVPAATNDLTIAFAGRYRNNIDGAGNTIGGNPGPADDGGTYTAEIVAHDPISQRLFVANGTTSSVNVLDVSAAPTTITQLGAIDFSAIGEPNSVSVSNGILAVAVGANTKTSPGSVYLFDAATTTYTTAAAEQAITVGALPDALTFSPDGTKLVVACEGEPNGYTTASIDPIGQVFVIRIPSDFLSNGGATAASVTVGDFFADGNAIQAFVDGGGRFYGAWNSVPAFPTNNPPSIQEDLEPEYVVISDDGTAAYVTLQENNGLAILDISTPSSPSVVTVLPLGVLSQATLGRGLDASNSTSEPYITTWPVEASPMPDAIAFATIGGNRYLFTANEGDAREYDELFGTTGDEEADDPRYGGFPVQNSLQDFPYNLLRENELLGRLRIDRAAQNPRFGQISSLRTFGSRSFSIWDASNGALVWDSGNLFEKITATDPRTAAFFNSNNDEQDAKGRSDDKGPEPEAITVAKINDNWYAFIGLERIGGIMVFNVTDPTNPTFEQYLINNRPAGASFSLTADDLGPEDVKFVRPEDSPTGEALLLVANEVSGTVQFYSFTGVTSNERAQAPNTVLGGVQLTPNPVADYLYVRGEASANQAITLDLFDLSGSRLKTTVIRPQTTGAVNEQVYVGDLAPGLYIVNLQQGGRASAVRIVKQ